MSIQLEETPSVSYAIHVTYKMAQMETLYAASFQDAIAYARSLTDIIHDNTNKIQKIDIFPFKKDPDHPGISRIATDKPIYTVALYTYSADTSTTTASTGIYPTQLLPTQPHKYISYVTNYHPPTDKKGDTSDYD